MFWKDDLKERYPNLHYLTKERNRKLFEKEFPEVKDRKCWGCVHCDVRYFPVDPGFSVRCKDPHLYYQCMLTDDNNRINHYMSNEEACIIALFDDDDKGAFSWYKYKGSSTESLMKRLDNLEILDETIPADDDEIFHWDVDEKTFVTTNVDKLPEHYFGGIIFRALVVYLVSKKENYPE